MTQKAYFSLTNLQKHRVGRPGLFEQCWETKDHRTDATCWLDKRHTLLDPAESTQSLSSTSIISTLKLRLGWEDLEEDLPLFQSGLV